VKLASKPWAWRTLIMRNPLLSSGSSVELKRKTCPWFSTTGVGVWRQASQLMKTGGAKVQPQTIISSLKTRQKSFGTCWISRLKDSWANWETWNKRIICLRKLCRSRRTQYPSRCSRCSRSSRSREEGIGSKHRLVNQKISRETPIGAPLNKPADLGLRASLLTQ
jgi:hypothetical protein